MTIGTECPHCESVFQVAADLIGKPMRCPNPACREVFTVAPTAEVVAPPPPTAPNRGGAVGDFVPVYEAVEEPPATVPVAVYDAEPVLDAEPVRPTPPKPKLKPPAVQKAAPLPPLAPPKRAPQVLDWQAEQEKATARKPKPRTDADVPLRSRRRGSKFGGVILVSLILLVLGVGGVSAWLVIANNQRSEEKQAEEAEAQYKEGRFPDAKKKFDDLAKDFPNSPGLDRYRFMSALASTQAAVSGVGLKDDPTPGRKALAAFVAEYADHDLAKPTTGLGADVVTAGQKLGTAIADHAADKVKKFQGDRTKPELLDAADKTIADGRELLPTLEKFRDRNGLSFDDVRKKLDEAEAGVKKERDRLAALLPWRKLADDPTDVSIDAFEKAMKAAKLADDAEAKGLAAAAKAALRELVKFGKDPAAPGTPPAEPGPSFTAAPRVFGSPDAKDPRKGDVVFGVGHGVLFALDARTGEKLWAERVLSEPRPADAPLRVKFQDGAKDWVLVPSVRGGQAALTARVTLTGEVEWHLPLPAPVLGLPVQVGMMLYVPLADARGTLLQVELASGQQVGKVELRQPIGGGVAKINGANAGHAFLIVPADARRVFVFEAGKLGVDGKRQPPQVVRVFATEHPRDSLRGPPKVVEAGKPDAPRRVILAQTDGPKEMKLRAFSLPSNAELGTPSAEGDTPPGNMAEATVGGWAWFPPITDGERVAVATDSGVFAAFGLNLPGSADKPLYQLPAQATDAAAVSRCQVVHMDEDGYWVVRGNKLTRLRVVADPREGHRIVPQIDPKPVGEPIAAAQKTADGLGVITVKDAATGIVQVLAFDTNSGDVRWRRQLGVMAAAPPIPLTDGGRLVIDTAGGVYKVAAGGAELTLLEKCEPREAVVAPAQVAVSADGERVWVVTHEPAFDQVKFFVRTVVNGKPQSDRVVNVTGALAGNPVSLGDRLLLPLASGFVQRIGLKPEEDDGKPLAWRTDKAKADAVCHLSATADGQFLMSDGGTSITRHKWPAGGKVAEKAGGPWELSGPATSPAVWAKAGGKEWVLATDTTGVSVFDPTKQTTDPARRWTGAADPALPTGKCSMLAMFGEKAVWVIDGKAVACGDPASDKAEWVYPLPADAGEVIGLTPTDAGLLVAYASGTVLELNAAGEAKAQATAITTTPPAATAPTRITDRELLLPHADGTMSKLTLQKK